MNDKRASLEIIAPSVEEAIEKGLGELGVPEDAVDVEVLDPGSKGLFGLGSRHARVRLTLKPPEQPEREGGRPSQQAPKAPPQAVPRKPPARPGPTQEERVPSAAVPPQAEPGEDTISGSGVKPELKPSRETVETAEEDRTLQIAQETVSELLEKMRIKANVTARYGEPDEPQSRVPVKVDIRGKDLSILIGPRAETLNALQYISNLIIGKELGHSIPLVVDVEGYRERREQQIRQLARRMADQALRTGRRQMLEPMPANERRLVHIELRKNPDVSTQSVGEEPRRKVTIIPEK